MLGRRGFIKALAALAAATQVPLALQAEAESLLQALLKARTGDGKFLFLVRKEDWKALWAEMQDWSRFSSDTGFVNILVRGVPVVYLKDAGRLLGHRQYALITEKAYLKNLEQDSLTR